MATLNIAIVIVHNQSNEDNEAQIDALNNMLQKQIETVTDAYGNTSTGFVGYKLKTLKIDHWVKVYQIIPYQPENTREPYEAIKPSNMGILYSHNVIYGKGDEQMTGKHPRFINWGCKRSFDYGADIVFHIKDYKLLTVDNLQNMAKELIENKEYVETSLGRLITKKAFRIIGQLKEDRAEAQAIAEYKTRIIEKGYTHG